MRYTALFLTLLLTPILRAQTNSAVGGLNGIVSSPSPNSATLGTYGKIPVSLYTGMPNVDIPIYTLKFNDLSLPISLSYQYRGFRPNEHPSWVGEGWVLNAGGVITRIKKGEADEIKIPNSSYEYGYLYANNRGMLSNVSSNFTTLLLGQGVKDINSINASGATNGNTFFDTEPDEFVFNFNGFSGKFYYSNTNPGKWVVQSNQSNSFDIQVDVESTTGLQITSQCVIPRYIKQITLTDKDGIKYIFGGDYYNDNNIEVSFGAPSGKYGTSSSSEKGNNAYTSAWYLKKIQSPNNMPNNYNTEISLFYDSYNSASEIIPFFEIEQYNVGATTFKKTNFNTYTVSASTSCYLKEIWAGNKKVEFIRSSTHVHEEPSASNNWQGVDYDKELMPKYTDKLIQNAITPYSLYGVTVAANNLFTFQNFWQRLDAIKVSEVIYSISLSSPWTTQKTIELSYYDTYPMATTQTGRLELKSIDIRGRDNNLLPYYQFQYYPHTSSNFEDYGSRKVDHWGYYNGTDFFQSVNDTLLVNSTGGSISGYEYSRETPSIVPICIGGALFKMIYPTGGVTKFEYESNTYRKVPEYSTSSGISLYTENSDKLAGGLRVSRITDYATTNSATPNLNISGPPVTKEYYYVNDYPTNSVSSGVLNSGRPKYYETGSLSVYLNNTDPASPVSPYSNYHYWSNMPINPLETAGYHIGYSKVVEKYSDGSYKLYEFSNSDNGINNNQFLDQATNIQQSSFNVGGLSLVNDLIYNSTTSLSSERGKLLNEFYYTSAGTLKKEVKYEYNADNSRFSEVVNSIRKKGRLLPYSPSQSAYYTLRSYVSKIYVYHHYLKKITENNYLDNGGVSSIANEYTYDADRNINYSKTTGSANTSSEVSYKYSNDNSYSTPTTTVNIDLVDGIKNLRTRNIRSALIEKLTRKNANGTGYITSGELYAYKSDVPVLSQTYRLDIDEPTTVYQSSSLSSNTFNKDSRYKLYSSVTKYNQAGYANEVNENGRKTACVRDYQQRFMNGIFKNAAYDEVAYTSFEGVYDPNPGLASNVIDPNKGNWKFATYFTSGSTDVPLVSKDPIPTTYSAFTGNWSYEMTHGQNSVIWSTTNLIPGKAYTISFWYKGVRPNVTQNYIPITDGLPGFSNSGNTTKAVSFDLSNPNSTWTYWEAAFIANGFPINIYAGSSGCDRIDELRLHPFDADVKTYTYDTENGITTENNNISYILRYKYDEFGRLTTIREADNSIRRKYEYKQKEQE